MITMNWDVRGLKKKIEMLSAIGGTVVADELPKETRLLSVELARYTQPFGFEDSARKKGEGSIRRDLVGGKTRKGIFSAMPDYIIDSAEETGERPQNRVVLFTKKDGSVYGVEKTLWKPNAGPTTLKKHHTQYFKKGKMTSAGGRTRDIGRWKFVDKMVVRQSKVFSYFERVSKKVGLAKGGWAACARALGSTRGIPQWVKRHRKGELGRVVDRSKKKWTPFIQIKNLMRYTSQVLSRSNQRAAIKDREIKLQIRIENALKHKARKV